MLTKLEQAEAARQAWAIRAAEESARADALLEAVEQFLYSSMSPDYVSLRAAVEAAKVKHGE